MPSYKGKARGGRVVANSAHSGESASGQTAVESGSPYVAGPSTGSTNTRATRSSTRAACTANLGAPQPEIIDLTGDTLVGSGFAEGEENDEEEEEEDDDEEQWEEAADDDAEEEEEEEADDTLVAGESGEEHGFSDMDGDINPAEGPDSDDDEYCDSEVDESEDLEDVGDVELNEEEIEALRQTGVLVEDTAEEGREEEGEGAEEEEEKEEEEEEEKEDIQGMLLDICCTYLDQLTLSSR